MGAERIEANQILAVTPDQVQTEPFPHLVGDPFLKPDLYTRLKDEYPDDHYFEKALRGGRTGRDFYSNSKHFEAFLDSSPAWREFHTFINSSAFVEFVVGVFQEQLDRFGCKIDPERAHYVDYEEPEEVLGRDSNLTRWSKEIRRKLGLISTAKRDDLFVRFDIEQGASGYGKPVHCDIENRLASLVLYFCDAEALDMHGGNLRIHEHRHEKPMSRYERHPKEEDTRIVSELRPKDNLGVLFLCPNNSYHSVTPITQSEGYRKFIYLNVSSRAETIW